MTQKRIVIMLDPIDSSRADWVCFSETGEITQNRHDGDLHDLTPLARESNITVFVPAQDVLLTQTTLPKLTRNKLLQALPYALEEQLISDLDELHFAIGEHQADGQLPVAVVAKNKMQQWIDNLKMVGIEASVMLPTTLAIPYQDGHDTIYSYRNSYIIRTGLYSGYVADNQPINHDAPIKTWDNHFQDIANQFGSQRFINLLQKPYIAKRTISHTKNVWKFAAYFAAAWIAIGFTSNLISFLILEYQFYKIEKQIKHIYFSYFPNATSLNSPKERMESKLKEITQTTQKNNFLGLLATISKSLSDTHGMRIQNMDYRNGQMTLEVSSASFDTIETIIQSLTTQGLTVKQQNSTTVGSQVKATLIINAGAA